jgi:hypothetical protein
MRNDETRMANRPYLDDFVEEQLMAQLTAALQRGEIASTISRGVWNLGWALERGLLHSPLPDLLLLSMQDTIFLWQLGIRADNELEIWSGFVRRLFARNVRNR